MISFSALQEYAHSILTFVPWHHWVVIGLFSLALTILLLVKKMCSLYGAIVLGLTVFMSVLLLDTAVGIRYLGIMKHTSGHNLALDFSRMFQKSGQGPIEILSNFAVFVPLGFFFGEWLASLNQTSSWHRVGIVTLSAFGLSLCIECLQLVLKVGFFEVTDLLLNTVGGWIGGSLSVIVRKVFMKRNRFRFGNN